MVFFLTSLITMATVKAVKTFLILASSAYTQKRTRTRTQKRTQWAIITMFLQIFRGAVLATLNFRWL